MVPLLVLPPSLMEKQEQQQLDGRRTSFTSQRSARSRRHALLYHAGCNPANAAAVDGKAGKAAFSSNNGSFPQFLLFICRLHKVLCGLKRWNYPWANAKPPESVLWQVVSLHHRNQWNSTFRWAQSRRSLCHVCLGHTRAQINTRVQTHSPVSSSTVTRKVVANVMTSEANYRLTDWGLICTCEL